MENFERLSNEEIQEMYYKYAKNWGRVSFESFKELMFHKYQIEGDANTRLLRFIFEALDGEGFFNFDDGYLNCEEFVKVMYYFPKQMPMIYGSLVTILFNILDKNHDKSLDRKELAHFFTKIQSDAPDLVSQAMIEDCDANNDGIMQFDEFVQFIKKDTF